MPEIADNDDFGCRQQLPILCDESSLLTIEIDNVLSLGEFVLSLADEWDGKYFFTPDLICRFNQIAMHGIYDCAGNYRTTPRLVSHFVPPNYRLVPSLIHEMCDYANANRNDPFHVAAFLLWRTNWIHPFYDGNGRTSRELCHLALLAETGDSWSKPLPQLIAEAEADYLEGLIAADRAWSGDFPPDVWKLQMLLQSLYIDYFEQ